MNLNQTAAVLALVATSGALWAIPQQGLRRVPPTQEQELVRSEWQPALTDPDLDKREQAYANLMDLARSSPSAQRDLEEWSQDPTDPLLAWTSRLALRELRWSARDHGSPWGRFGRSPLGDDFGVHGLLEQLQRDLDQLQGRMGGMQPLTPFQVPRGMPAPGTQSRSDGFSMQMSPDGVRVEVRKMVDGDEQVRVYEADTLEELLEANPELEPQVQSHQQFLRTPFRDRGFSLQPSPPTSLVPRDVPRDRSVLGVLAEVREEGGLVIAQVLPDTIADDLELLVDEVVLEINGSPIRVHADVRRALTESDADEPVVVTILDATGKRKELIWTPR